MSDEADILFILSKYLNILLDTFVVIGTVV